MTKRWIIGLMINMLAATPAALAAEHGGHEHGGSSAPAQSAPSASQEHGGATTHEHGGQPTTQAEPSPERIRETIREYVTMKQKRQGQFVIKDDVTGATRRLTLVRVHKRVGKTGNLFYSCTDMRDIESREMLDLDFDVKHDQGKLTVVDERIHKVGGKARYTYDDHDNRIPVKVQ